MPSSRLTAAVLAAGVLSVVCAPGCSSRGVPDPAGERPASLTATISITGQVTDAGGLGLGGVTVTLAGNVSKAIKTDAKGSYAFTSLNAGSYSVRPTFKNCAFVPDVVNLNNLKTSV